MAFKLEVRIRWESEILSISWLGWTLIPSTEVRSSFGSRSSISDLFENKEAVTHVLIAETRFSNMW